jgi:hypothetical protein
MWAVDLTLVTDPQKNDLTAGGLRSPESLATNGHSINEYYQ